MNSHTTQKELEILNSIHYNDDVTQRDLSEKTGMSLGAVNLLIKRMTEKGLIKVVHLQPYSIKYFLTPSGIANKIERTYQYIARTYREIKTFQMSIINILNTVITEDNRDAIFFIGEDDEFQSLITDILKKEFFIKDQQIFKNTDKLIKHIEKLKKPKIITWNSNCEGMLKTHSIECINIMKDLTLKRE